MNSPVYIPIVISIAVGLGLLATLLNDSLAGTSLR
jgi:hypothetical protein